MRWNPPPSFSVSDLLEIGNPRHVLHMKMHQNGSVMNDIVMFDGHCQSNGHRVSTSAQEHPVPTDSVGRMATHVDHELMKRPRELAVFTSQDLASSGPGEHQCEYYRSDGNGKPRSMKEFAYVRCKERYVNHQEEA